MSLSAVFRRVIGQKVMEGEADLENHLSTWTLYACIGKTCFSRVFSWPMEMSEEAGRAEHLVVQKSDSLVIDSIVSDQFPDMEKNLGFGPSNHGAWIPGVYPF